MTDSLIVSRTLGVNALAAVGASDWLSYMMISIVQAISQGFAIMLAQDFGSEDTNKLRKTLAHSIRLAVILTAAVTAGALLLMNPLLTLMDTPDTLMPMTSAYLGIIYAGLPATMLMNFGSSVLKAFGNSKTPLYAIAVSATLNVGLDLLLVSVFDFGVGGAAFATVFSQFAAGLFCIYVLTGFEFIHLSKDDFKSEPGLNKKLMQLCWPMILQNMTISLGGLVVQSRVNAESLSFIAGYTATNKVYGMLEMAAIAYGYAMVTYIGQNYGACKIQRVKQGIFDAVKIAVITSLCIAVMMLLFGRQLTGMFLTGDSADVVSAGETAYRFLCIMAVPLPVLYLLYIARSVLQGLGNTVVPMISGIAECAARVLISIFAVGVIGSDAMLIAEPAAWFMAMLILMGSMISSVRKLEHHTL